MTSKKNIGIIICDRYQRCAGGKCFRSMREREGAFSRYKDIDIELVGYTTCDGCPGGNIEYAVDEMVSNGVQVVHLATGLIVGYPPCPYITTFHDFIKSKYGLGVIYGTHPIPEKYLTMHTKLDTWNTPEWQSIIADTLGNEKTQLAYN